VLDVFTLLRRGRLGVAVTPIQLDAAGRTNLSGIGPPGRPKAAMIGPRGLPENNDTPSPLWYLVPQHSPRTLVGRVDMVCGPAPTGLGPRVLLTPAGRFELRDGVWHLDWITPGGHELINACPEFAAETPTTIPVVKDPKPDILAVLERVDPTGARRREFGE
jgi:glutaconate CoA-transferase subunit B